MQNGTDELFISKDVELRTTYRIRKGGCAKYMQRIGTSLHELRICAIQLLIYNGHPASQLGNDGN